MNQLSNFLFNLILLFSISTVRFCVVFFSFGFSSIAKRSSVFSLATSSFSLYNEILFFIYIYILCTVCVISFLSASLCVEPN